MFKIMWRDLRFEAEKQTEEMKRNIKITYLMRTKVGVLGIGKIAAKNPASSEPATRRKSKV